MVLHVEFLDNVIDINNFDTVKQLNLYEGQIKSIYIKLKTSKGVRYIPQGVYSLDIELPSIDTAQYQSITATQPFAEDKSVFKIDLPSTVLPKTGSIIVNLTENGVISNMLVNQGIVVHILNQGSN